MKSRKVLCPVCAAREIDPRASQCIDCRYGRSGPVVDVKPIVVSAAEALDRDRQRVQKANEETSLRAKYKEALARIDRLETDLGVSSELQASLAPYTIGEKSRTGVKPQATVIAVASDWHFETTVGAEVGGLNTFNRVIATDRIQCYFRKVNSLTHMLAQDIEIDTIVLALLGDFITNDIHNGEQSEANSLAPMLALVEVQNHIAAGIEYLLAHSSRNIVIPCHSGNHARVTHNVRFHAENGHSLEYLMYRSLEGYFRHEPRVQFLVAEGPHSYLDVQGLTVRFQHGHMVKYGGGVGGIYIPVHKAIAQWNKAKQADLDIFGHFHQLVDGGNFVCNGSLIGYDSFALSIKASFDVPKQALILVDSKRGRTALWPIYL